MMGREDEMDFQGHSKLRNDFHPKLSEIESRALEILERQINLSGYMETEDDYDD